MDVNRFEMESAHEYFRRQQYLEESRQAAILREAFFLHGPSVFQTAHHVLDNFERYLVPGGFDLDYDKKSEFLELPENVLLRILRYLDNESRDECIKTCKLLYELVCEVEKDRFRVSISDKMLPDSVKGVIFQSLMKSKRTVTELNIRRLMGKPDQGTLDKLELIFWKFGPRVTTLTISSDYAQEQESYLIKLLSYVPKLKSLTVKRLVVEADNSFGEELDLYKLRKLELYNVVFKSTNIPDRIPADVLTELNYTMDRKCVSLQNFFNRQTKIVKLEIQDNDCNRFDHLNLQHLKVMSSKRLHEMIGNQPQLQFLQFFNESLCDNTLKTLSELRSLEVLRITGPEVTERVFNSFKNLPSLKTLICLFGTYFDTATLTQMNLRKLENWGMFVLREIANPSVTLPCIMRKHENLRRLYLHHVSCKTVISILDHLTDLESIRLDSIDMPVPRTLMFFERGKVREKLKKFVILNIHISDFDIWDLFFDFLNSCPNLQQISFGDMRSLSDRTLARFLRGRKQLTAFRFDVDLFDFNTKCYHMLSALENLKHFHINAAPRERKPCKMCDKIFANEMTE